MVAPHEIRQNALTTFTKIHSALLNWQRFKTGCLKTCRCWSAASSRKRRQWTSKEHISHLRWLFDELRKQWQHSCSCQADHRLTPACLNSKSEISDVFALRRLHDCCDALGNLLPVRLRLAIVLTREPGPDLNQTTPPLLYEVLATLYRKPLRKSTYKLDIRVSEWFEWVSESNTCIAYREVKCFSSLCREPLKLRGGFTESSAHQGSSSLRSFCSFTDVQDKFTFRRRIFSLRWEN